MSKQLIPALPPSFRPSHDLYAVVVCTTMAVINWNKQGLSELILYVHIGSWRAFCDALFVSDNVYQLWVFDCEGGLIEKYIANG